MRQEFVSAFVKNKVLLVRSAVCTGSWQADEEQFCRGIDIASRCYAQRIPLLAVPTV